MMTTAMIWIVCIAAGAAMWSIARRAARMRVAVAPASIHHGVPAPIRKV